MESREPYSLERIEELYEHLVFRAQSGQPIDYEIRLDHLVVVQRTNDPERFHEFETQLRDTTRELYIVFFKGTSRKSDKHCFVLQEVAEPESFQQQLEEAVRREKEAMLIRLSLADRGSPYAALLEAVCATLPGASPSDRAGAMLLAGPPPAEAVGLEPYGRPLIPVTSAGTR